MRLQDWLTHPRTRLDIVAGLVDGIINALILAAGRLLKTHGGDVSLVVRVCAVTGLTSVFVFFMAHYAELRAELFRAEKELNLLSHGRLATSRLGRQAVLDAAAGALLAAACGMLGAASALFISMYAPGPNGTGLAVAIGLLGLLGALLARSVHGAPAIWAVAMVLGGAALTAIGVKIDIAG